MPIIACIAYSQITQAAAALQRARDYRSYVWHYQNSSVWESQESSSVCRCHNIIMSLSDEVLYFTEGIDSMDTPAHPLSCTALAASPPLAHETARSHTRGRHNVTMSSA